MTAYSTNPSTPVKMLIPGIPDYAFGSKNLSKPTVRAYVTAMALNSNVVTLTIQMVEGFIPSVGDLVTVLATTTDGGAANVANVAITGVNINSATGAGTITYAATGSNQGTTPDSGQVYIAVPEVPETAASGTKSRAFAIQNTIGRGYGISWSYTFPSAPASASIQLEGALNNNDAEYVIIGSAQTTVAGYPTIVATNPNLVNFVRLNMTALSGGSSPTIIGKISIS